MTAKPTRRLALAGALLIAAAPALAQTQTKAQTRPAPVPALSAADQALVNRAVAYLEGLARAKGRFTQTDQRGAATTGDFYIQRPGKIRFVYDPPNKTLVVSDGNQVVIIDQRLGTYQPYALRMSPLSLFLAKNIRLDRNVVVNNVTRLNGGFSITASDRTRETPGSITLVFADNPMQLREWTVTDPQRGRTRVVLHNLAPVASLDRSLFVLPRDPRPKAGVKGR